MNDFNRLLAIGRVEFEELLSHARPRSAAYAARFERDIDEMRAIAGARATYRSIAEAFLGLAEPCPSPAVRRAENRLYQRHRRARVRVLRLIDARARTLAPDDDALIRLRAARAFTLLLAARPLAAERAPASRRSPHASR